MPAAPKCPAYGCKFGAAEVLPRCVGLLQGWKSWQTGGKGRFAALPWVGKACFAALLGFGIYFVGVRL